MPTHSPRVWLSGAVTGLLLLSGCGGGSASISSEDVEHNARVVLRADLQPGSTGETAAEMVHRYFGLDGVAGTHGDAGQHVWVYSTPDATAAEVSAAMSALRADPSVLRVKRLR
jgi:hypothetical protein